MKNKGITLIALVITIVVLIILAGVSINLVLGENGLIEKAKQASKMAEIAQIKDNIGIDILNIKLDNIEDNQIIREDQIEKILSKYGTVNLNEEEKIAGITPKGKDYQVSIEDIYDGEIRYLETVASKIQDGVYVDENKVVKDSLKNIIFIPEGFKIAQDSGLTVEEGIVIEDNDIVEGIGNGRGNQFVWVPVGNVNKQDGTIVNIELGRYTFDDEGNETLVQSIDNYLEEILIKTGNFNWGYIELEESREGNMLVSTEGENATAVNLADFISKVKYNNGYYIARYEASYGIDEKPNSKVSNSIKGASTVPRKEGQLWNYINQINVSKVSRNMYNGTSFKSDLINSYAWDTALIYIKKCSNKENANNYASIARKNGNGPFNTGTNDDEQCKINDMRENIREWTTEYCSMVSGATSTSAGYNACATLRKFSTPSSRQNSQQAYGGGLHYGFRTILY